MLNAIEKLENAILEKNSRIVVRIIPEEQYVPKEYYKILYQRGYEEEYIVELFCKEFIDVISDSVSAVILNPCEFNKKNFLEIAEYAKIRGLCIVSEDASEQGIILENLMYEYRSYLYGEKKWKYVTRKILKKVIEESKYQWNSFFIVFM